MVRQNDKITSEEEAQVDTQADITPETDRPEDERIRQLRDDAQELPKAFPFPGDTQTQGSRHPAPNFLSSAVANELEMYGSTIDPATGARVTRDDFPAAFGEDGKLKGSTPPVQAE